MRKESLKMKVEQIPAQGIRMADRGFHIISPLELIFHDPGAPCLHHKAYVRPPRTICPAFRPTLVFRAAIVEFIEKNRSKRRTQNPDVLLDTVLLPVGSRHPDMGEGRHRRCPGVSDFTRGFDSRHPAGRGLWRRLGGHRGRARHGGGLYQGRA